MSELEKLTLTTHDNIRVNVEKIGELFPNCVTETKDKEGNLKKTIDFEMLKQMLSSDVVEEKERYEFIWPGKKASIAEANKPITKTLRPCIEESKDWDTTKNLYIEGDNLDALKLLQQSYLGKVKMIYIDPPYNTGNDFIYEDDFKKNEVSYSEDIGQYDEYGNRMFKNTDSNGRFHSDWCSMIYPRLLLARKLLSDDGVIFISIDDYEVRNMKIICDEIFGEHNFIAQLIWERAYSPKNDAKYVSISHDYILFYAKKSDYFKIGRLPRTEEANARYSNPDNDPRGPWLSDNLTVKTYSKSTDYPIVTPAGRIVNPPKGRCWRMSKNKYEELLKAQRLWFGADGKGVPRLKRFLSELRYEGLTPTSILFYKDVGHSQEGAQETSKILGGGYFNGPKPTRLIKHLLTLGNLSSNSIVLDFFSGSGSTADAVSQFGLEKNINIKFIMVQIQENCDVKTTAYANGYRTICDIGKDRIRRAGEKIKSENPDKDLDIGFRVLKIDSSNMKDVYFNPNELSQSLLSNLESNIKEDRSSEDLFFSCLLEFGLTLDKSIETKEISGKKVFIYNDNQGSVPDLIACFDNDVTEDVITEIAKKKPLKVVFRDDSFKDSPTKINLFEIFKMHAGITEESELRTRIKVI